MAPPLVRRGTNVHGIVSTFSPLVGLADTGDRKQGSRVSTGTSDNLFLSLSPGGVEV